MKIFRTRKKIFPMGKKNRPFPSSLASLFQSEFKCKTILMKMTWNCKRMKLQAGEGFVIRLVLKQRHKRTHCRNVRGLGRVSYIDYIENLNISTGMLLNGKLPSEVLEFSAENCSNESLAKVAKFHTNPYNCLPNSNKQTLYFR